MEVHLKPDTLEVVNRIAAEDSRDAGEYVQQLVESYIEHDAWFRGKVREGIAEADRGEVIDHEQMSSESELHFPG